MKLYHIGAALLFCTSVALQSQAIRFEVLTVECGLPDGTIVCMMKDRQGFMWFGTLKGLARYDGYSFKIFQETGSDSLTLSGAIVYALCEDQQGYIWAATVGGGLNKFNPRTEKFTRC
jgi:ligand-binding sensor domain-containing protein